MGVTLIRFFFAWLLIFVFLSASAFAGEPTDKIRETTDKIIAIMSNPALNGEDKKEERNKLIREAVDERFDWEEMSRRALARHWRKRTKEEKKEFIYLFGKLLERTYLDRVEGYSGEKVTYESEGIEENYALVEIKIITEKQTQIPVIYRLKNKGGKWLVYDILVEGVSFISNFRNQFNNEIINTSYEKMITKLKERVAK